MVHVLVAVIKIRYERSGMIRRTGCDTGFGHTVYADIDSGCSGYRGGF